MDKDLVVARVEECWQALRSEVEGLDLAAPVYPDPVWTVRDVLLHCAFWNDEAVKAIVAFRAGGEYRIADSMAAFDEQLDVMNAREIEASRSVPEDKVRERWIAAQDALVDAVEGLDAGMLSAEIMSPWCERVPLEQMIDAELRHEQGHVADVISAISASEGER